MTTNLNLKISHSMFLFDCLQSEINNKNNVEYIKLYEHEHYDLESNVYLTDEIFYEREILLCEKYDNAYLIAQIVDQGLPFWYNKYLKFCYFWQNNIKKIKRYFFLIFLPLIVNSFCIFLF